MEEPYGTPMLRPPQSGSMVRKKVALKWRWRSRIMDNQGGNTWSGQTVGGENNHESIFTCTVHTYYPPLSAWRQSFKLHLDLIYFSSSGLILLRAETLCAVQTPWSRPEMSLQKPWCISFGELSTANKLIRGEGKYYSAKIKRKKL